MSHSTSVSVGGNQLAEEAESHKSLVIDDSPMTSHFYEDELINLKLERHAPMTCASSTIMNYQKAHELSKDLTTSTRAMIAHFRWGQFVNIIHTASASTLTLNSRTGTFPSGSLTCFAADLIARNKGWGDIRGNTPRMIEGYNDWCLYILQKYPDALERLNIYGAVLSSLGVYHIDFQLLQSFFECWDKGRNVFATRWGDLSISLLDMESIGGLPIHGQVYDEYVPTNEELEDPEVKHGQPLKVLLNCYQYLRHISPVDNVSFEMWVQFFFYGQHHRVKSKGKSKNKCFDSIQTFGKNTPLAAFLTLWLCKFVVPYDLSYIRPDVFVIAARMADSRKPYSLAIPALCTLYREINYWVTDHLAVSCNWPIHYLVGWISQYFPNLYDRLPEDEIEMQFPSSNHRSDAPFLLQISRVKTSGSPYSAKEARKFLHEGGDEELKWRPYPISHSSNPTSLVDTSKQKISNSHSSFFLSVRQGILPLRMGKRLFTEPYNPQMFARQFGYDQEVPNPGFSCTRTEPILRMMYCYWRFFFRLGTGKHFVIPSDSRMGKTLHSYVIWYQKGYRNFFAEEVKKLYILYSEQNESSSSSSEEDFAEPTQIIKRKHSFVDDPKKKQRVSSDLVSKADQATSISQVRNKSTSANTMVVDLEDGEDQAPPTSVAPQRSPSLDKVPDKIASSTKNLAIFKDYREPASSGNSSDEDETQPKTNDSLSSNEDISKQDTPIQQDQMMVVPQTNIEASGSNNSVEQAIQVFLEESKDQVLCIISPSVGVELLPMHRIHHIKSRDEISELQRQGYSIHAPLMMVDKKQSDEAPSTPVIDVNDDTSDEGPVDPSVSSVADILLPIFVKEFCEQKPFVLFEQDFKGFIKLIDNKIALCGALGNSGGKLRKAFEKIIVVATKYRAIQQELISKSEHIDGVSSLEFSKSLESPITYVEQSLPTHKMALNHNQLCKEDLTEKIVKWKKKIQSLEKKIELAEIELKTIDTAEARLKKALDKQENFMQLLHQAQQNSPNIQHLKAEYEAYSTSFKTLLTYVMSFK